MPYCFPKIKFADTNTLEQQLEHVRSEHMEVWQAYMADELGHLVEELFDLQQSCDTCLRVIARLYPEMDLGAARQAMLQKNTVRGYYNAEEDHPEKASATGLGVPFAAMFTATQAEDKHHECGGDGPANHR